MPLCEKAYAKFNGSYNEIKGGAPCWALTELSGGIAVEMRNLTHENVRKLGSQGLRSWGIQSIFEMTIHLIHPH